MVKNFKLGRKSTGALVILLCVLVGLAFTAVPTTQTAEAKSKGKVHKIKTAKQWKNIAKYKGGKFKVVKNIKLKKTSQYLTIKKNKKYTIDLNGHKVVTTYSGTDFRSACPLTIKKGTVVLKSSKKNKGVLYSTEMVGISVMNKAKLYVKSGTIVNDTVNFKSGAAAAIATSGNAKCYLQKDCKIRSVNNGVYLIGKSKIYTTGHPWVRAGYLETSMPFTHYGAAIVSGDTTVKMSLKGGSFGTMAEPDIFSTDITGSVYRYINSGFYPILDMKGGSLKTAKGYKYVDANKKTVKISTYFMQKMLETTVKDSAGYYTIYVVKK